MADLSSSDDVDRAQLILVAAIVLAVTFVGLAIVVNSAIFSENLATRGDVPGSGDALDYQYEVTQSVGGIMMSVNENNSVHSDEIQEGVDDITLQGGLQQAQSGRVVDIGYTDDEDGERVARDDPGPMNTTDEHGDAKGDWTPAEGVDAARNVQFNFTDMNGPFTLVLEDGNDFWNMTVDPGENIEVEINESGTVTAEGECSIETDTPEVDVTAASVDGERCQALERTGQGDPLFFGTNIDGNFDIKFENSDEVEGTYSMIVRGGSPLDIDLDLFDNDDDVLYSVTVDYKYTTSAVRYETEITVAPGEVPP